MVTATMPGTRTQSEGPVGQLQLLRPRKRGDSLPEFTRYRDDGCEVNESCLTCPLPRCRYEEPGGLRAILNEVRDNEIIVLRGRGVSVDAIADRFSVSRRTVFRVLGSANDQSREEARRRKAAEDFEPIPIRPIQPAYDEEMRREANCA